MKTYERLLRKFGRVYRKDTYVFREGETGREMYYILSGRIRVEKSTGHVKKILTEMGPGEYFGEMALLADMSRSASALAVEDSIIAVIDEDTFHRLLIQSMGVSLLFLREFSYRLKSTTEALENMSRSWLKLVTVLYFIKEWPFPSCQGALVALAARTGREVHEIMEILLELERDGAIEMKKEAGEIEAFHRDRVWKYLDYPGKRG